MKRALLIFGVVISVVQVGFPCTPSRAASVAVPLRGQETGVWCWAASGEMCMDFLGRDVTQCEQASKQFTRNCCRKPMPDGCVNSGWPDFNHFGFNRERTTDTALSWAQLRDQIYCKKKPFAFSWHYPGNAGHMMVVKGYAETNGTRYVYYANPLPRSLGSFEFRPYGVWVTGPGIGYSHWDDFYDITKQ